MSVMEAVGTIVQHDQDLVAEMQGGSEEALSSLYDRYSPTIHAIALRILGDSGEAEEVVIDVFWQTWRQADRFDPSKGNALAWLLTIARSRALERRRTHHRRSKAEPRVVANMGEFAGTGDLREEVEIVQLKEKVSLALGKLSDERRQSIEMAYFRGLSHREIAEELDQPLGTVKTRVRTGLIELRGALAPLV